MKDHISAHSKRYTFQTLSNLYFVGRRRDPSSETNTKPFLILLISILDVDCAILGSCRARVFLIETCAGSTKYSDEFLLLLTSITNKIV